MVMYIFLIFLNVFKLVDWLWNIKKKSHFNNIFSIFIFADEMPNFITDYKLRFWVYKELVIYIFCD